MVGQLRKKLTRLPNKRNGNYRPACQLYTPVLLRGSVVPGVDLLDLFWPGTKGCSPRLSATSTRGSSRHQDQLTALVLGVANDLVLQNGLYQSPCSTTGSSGEELQKNTQVEVDPPSHDSAGPDWPGESYTPSLTPQNTSTLTLFLSFSLELIQPTALS